MTMTAYTPVNPIIARAVEPRREQFVADALARVQRRITQVHEELAAAGWNLDAVAPRPHGGMGRARFLVADARREFCRCITEPVAAVLRPGQANYVRRSERGVQRLLEMTAADARVAFDAYVVKLSTKVGAVASASLDDRPLWDGSILTVVTADGETVRWLTRTITNVSVLGKLFNQWPTRRLKR